MALSIQGGSRGKPVTIKVVGFMHAGIRVAPDEASIARAEEVYRDMLGLPMDAKRPEIPGNPGFWSNIAGPAPDLQVHVMGADGSSPAAQSERHDPTCPHLALAVEGLEAAKQELGRREVEFWIYGGLVGPASEQVFFEDGCGNMIELQRAAG
jgi:hypothetical protein